MQLKLMVSYSARKVHPPLEPSPLITSQSAAHLCCLLSGSILAASSLPPASQQCPFGTGLPTVVARRMLQQGGLVGRVVTSGSDAIKAAADGADLVFLEIPSACHSAV